MKPRLSIFEKCLKSCFDIVERKISARAFDPAKKFDLQNDFNILVAKQWKIRKSVPMSYIICLEYVVNDSKKNDPSTRPQTDKKYKKYEK